MGKISKLTPEDVIAKAVSYFGPSGLGLEVIEQDLFSAKFEAMGGFVNVAAGIQKEGGSEVSIVGREFEFQIRQFIGKI